MSPATRTHQQVLASQPCQAVEREQQQQRAAPTQARLHQDKRREDEAEGGRHLRIDLRAVDKEGSAEPQQPSRDNGCAEVPGDAIGKEHHARRGQAADESQEPLSRIDAASRVGRRDEQRQPHVVRGEDAPLRIRRRLVPQRLGMVIERAVALQLVVVVEAQVSVL